MYDFFGKFDSMEDLESRMVNTFMEDPKKYMRTFAKRIICESMKVIKNPEGGITVFWNDTEFEENYKWN